MLLPLRDTIRGDRAPVATIGLIALVAGLHVARLDGGWEVLHLVADAVVLWVLGATLEETLGRAGVVALCVGGGLVALGPDGAVAAVAGGYLALHLRGRVLAALLVPLLFTMVELPAVLLVALWAAQLLAFEGLGPQAAACAAAFAAALVAVRVLARPKTTAPSPYRVA